MREHGMSLLSTSEISTIKTSVATGAILALFAAVGAFLLSFVIDGGVIALLGGATHPGDPVRLVNIMTPTPIPGSTGAKFCAITSADFASPFNSCTISYDKEKKAWNMQNGGTSGAANCVVTCLI
jgi:hypothetical protein